MYLRVYSRHLTRLNCSSSTMVIEASPFSSAARLISATLISSPPLEELTFACFASSIWSSRRVPDLTDESVDDEKKDLENDEVTTEVRETDPRSTEERAIEERRVTDLRDTEDRDTECRGEDEEGPDDAIGTDDEDVDVVVVVVTVVVVSTT